MIQGFYKCLVWLNATKEMVVFKGISIALNQFQAN
jgi:hypothetical protein